MRLNPLQFALIFCAMFPCPSAHTLASDIELFVAVDGDDTALGTEGEPLATLAGAQLRLRSLRQENASQSAQVWIGHGVYPLVSPLMFTADDNGDEQSTTTYSARAGQSVVLRGGVQLQAWQTLPADQLPREIPESARPHVRVIDLAALGINELAMHPRRSRHTAMQPTVMELFSGSQRLPAAGWPNTGWARVPEAIGAGRSWHIDSELHAIEHATHAWAHGFWQHDWQDSCEPISLTPRSIGAYSDRQAHRLQVAIEHEHLQSVRAGARYRIENLLSELDAPGEWFVDHARHLLYLWPLDNRSSSRPEDYFVSTMDTPISCYDVERLTLRGLTIEGARASCVEVVGGQQVKLDHCIVRHAGNLGINIYHGSQHRVTGCQVSSTGAGAIRVEGGHRETLSSAEHLIEQNRLEDYCQLQWSYRPGVNVYGVGITIQNNEISHAPHAAIILHGNDHFVLNNDIHHVCTETDDVGAVYLGHNPTYRGNVIRNNHIHDLGGFSRTGVIGIYLDDFASGTTVSHNLLERAGRGVAIGGGRDNVIENNLFIDCLAAVQIDCRGTSWAKHFVEGNDSHYARCISELSDDWEYYTQRYPELAEVMADAPAIAKGNRITGNLYEAPIGIDLQEGLDQSIVLTRDNFAHARQLLVDVAHGDYRLKPTASEALTRFQPIERASVGPNAETSNVPIVTRRVSEGVASDDSAIE